MRLGPAGLWLTCVLGCPSPASENSTPDAGGHGGSASSLTASSYAASSFTASSTAASATSAPPSSLPPPSSSATASSRSSTSSLAASSSSSIADAGVADAVVTSDAGTVPGLPDPILFVHGINGAAENWATMVERFVADGWPRERLMARTFPDPSWGCNVDNAALLQTWANELMTTTGTTRIDVVAHSMGTLSSRHYVKMLMNTGVVNTYVTVGGMNHGLTSPCWSPLPVCVWQELCATGMFVSALNAPPATPPPTTWVSIFSDGDTKVPTTSSQLDDAENILVHGLEHDGPNGLQESEMVYQEVKRVVQYPGH